MSILAVLTRTTNTRYMRHVLDLMKDVTVVTPYEYLTTPQDEYDAIIYNTFPDEHNAAKFQAYISHKADAKFAAFKGRRLLFDTHDNGTRDGFERFHDSSTPRIKVNPGVKLMKRMNIIASMPYIVYRPFMHPQEPRTVPLLCSMRTDGLPDIRKQIADKVRPFNPADEWIPMVEHARKLCRTRIHVVSPGWGDSNLSHTETLAAGALLFAHEDILKVSILPFASLGDGANFVSFNLDNLVPRLTELLAHPEKADKVRLAGLRTFRSGYDYARSAEQIKGYL